MTIDELLEEAQATCSLMDLEMGRDRGTLERAAQYAAIAQAAAQTAQAMIDHERFKYERADAERAELRVEYEIPGWYEGQPSAVAPF